MKVFISWSGERSRKVAELLDRWVQCVIQAVDPWVSSQDIDRGSLWFSEITNQLASTTHGIICLTKSNKEKPWILFEAGALAKGLNSSRVFTFLIDLKPEEIKDPLAQFNHTAPTKESLYKLILTINNSLQENRLKDQIIISVFETYWPQFNEEFERIISSTSEETVAEVRDKEDILTEVLNSIRSVDKRLRNIESEKERNEIPVSNRKMVRLPSMKDLQSEILLADHIRESMVIGVPEEDIINDLKDKYSERIIRNIINTEKIRMGNYQ